MDDPADERLLADTAAGDADAFAAFFRRHEPAVTRFCTRRCETPDDVADAVAYLVSDGSGFVTGQRLVVNGGFHFG